MGAVCHAQAWSNRTRRRRAPNHCNGFATCLSFAHAERPAASAGAVVRTSYCRWLRFLARPARRSNARQSVRSAPERGRSLLYHDRPAY